MGASRERREREREREVGVGEVDDRYNRLVETFGDTIEIERHIEPHTYEYIEHTDKRRERPNI